MCEIKTESDFRSPDVPKVVTSEKNELIYMSRSGIPSGKSQKFEKANRQMQVIEEDNLTFSHPDSDDFDDLYSDLNL